MGRKAINKREVSEELSAMGIGDRGILGVASGGTKYCWQEGEGALEETGGGVCDYRLI